MPSTYRPGSAEDALERALQHIDEHEATVRAWTVYDAEAARAAAHALDTGAPVPLRGIVLGVKDVFDTADLPTAYGSRLYEGFRPRGDAAAVAILRAAGAVVLGKTVTAEFALMSPGPTTNPHRSTHTPGGSSSGSAAAVACGMADLALGTQTAGSVLRPASFCGVYGFKPSFDSVATAGMKPVAWSLDTVGWFARDVATIDAARVALTARAPASGGAGAPRVAVVRTDDWERADADTHDAIERAAAAARDAGAEVTDRDLPPEFDGLVEDQVAVMQYEMVRSLVWERRSPELLSTLLQERLAEADTVTADAYDAARARTARARARADDAFGDAEVLLTPAAVGEAPAGLASTGDPHFTRIWTLLGWPTLCVPAGRGSSGLPVGVQLVGRPGDDAGVLAVGAWLGERTVESGTGGVVGLRP